MAVARRPATVGDEAFAQRVHHLAYRDVVERQFGRWDEREQDEYFQAAWPKHEHDIIEWDGVACGYVAVEVSATKVDIHELVVHPDYQNRGIGTGVLREVISLGRSLGLAVHLQVLLTNPAVSLYKRHGFEECGRTATHRLMCLPP